MESRLPFKKSSTLSDYSWQSELVKMFVKFLNSGSGIRESVR